MLNCDLLVISEVKQLTKRAEFGLLRDLLGRIPWGYSPREKRGSGDMIDFFKDNFLQTQE